jgi:ABC-type dipeptide/oligopeptide/nickel transport system permease component
MKTKSIIQNHVFRIALGTAVILLIPLMARWPWTLGDFVIMGVLISGTGLAYKLLTKTANKNYRLTVGIVLLMVFLLVWAELAVGIFGTPFAGS